MSKAAAVLEAPNPTHGHPLGVDDWRLAVEAWLSTPGTAQWGIAKWGEATWAEVRWVDITADVRGISITRGSDQPHGVPRVGTCSLTLANIDAEYSPWNPDPETTAVSKWAPGTTVRVVVHDGTTWHPLFTGDTDDWPETLIEGGAERFIELQLVDPFARLASIDGVAQSVLESAGENITARVGRILAAAGWPYGLDPDPDVDLDLYDDVIALDATTLEGNRITELQTAADSAMCEVYAGADGRARITGRYKQAADVQLLLSRDGEPDPAYPDAVPMAYDIAPFETSNNTEHVVNSVIVNGVQYSNKASLVRYGRRDLTRTLISSIGNQFALVTLVARAFNTLRVGSVPVTFTTRIAEAIDLAALDFGTRVAVYPPHVNPLDPDPPHITGWLAAVSHQIAPRNPSGADWRTTIGVDTAVVHNIPGAQL
jgi:hypothetical protein